MNNAVPSDQPVELGECGLTVQLLSGSAYFNYYWLRDNAPDCFDRQTRERIFDIVALDTPPVPQEAWMDAGSLWVRWSASEQSQYGLAWLQSHLDGTRKIDIAQMPRRLWRGSHYDAFARFDAATVHQNITARSALAAALIEDGIALVSGMANSDAALTELAQNFGSIRASVDGNYFDVRVHLNPVNLSFTSAALEMHTDTPAEEHPPGIQFLHCRENSAPGGESLFLDGAAVAEDFRNSHPSEFDILVTTTAPFYFDHDTFDWRARQHVIELDDNGSVSGVNVSQHMADVFDMPQRQLDRYYPAFVAFMKLMRDDAYVTRFRLNPGECIVFDNHRIVHGRDAYEPGRGKRYLRGCYIDRGELRSTYRTINRQTAARDTD